MNLFHQPIQLPLDDWESSTKRIQLPVDDSHDELNYPDNISDLFECRSHHEPQPLLPQDRPENKHPSLKDEVVHEAATLEELGNVEQELTTVPHPFVPEENTEESQQSIPLTSNSSVSSVSSLKSAHREYEPHERPQHDFPSTSLTRVPFTRDVSTTQTPDSPPAEKQSVTQIDQTHQTERRTSIATMAHSLLGDRYDDITEKLVYLKNSIVMNTDDEEDASDNEALRSAEREPKRRSSVELPVHSNSKPPIERQHRRSSSLMSVARLISGEETFSASSFLAALAGPTHQGPSSQHHPCPPLPEEDQLVEEDEEEFEDLFDFTKVLEMGKNVRTFTDDVMGSSIRLFKDFRDGVKEANEEPVEGWIVNDAYM